MKILRYILKTISWMLSKASDIIKLMKEKIRRFMNEEEEMTTTRKVLLIISTFGLWYVWNFYCTKRRKNNNKSDDKSQELLEKDSNELVLKEVPCEFKEQVRKDLREYGYAVVFKGDQSLYLDRQGRIERGDELYIGIRGKNDVLVFYKDGSKEV